MIAALLTAAAAAQERFRRTPPSPDPIQRLQLPEIESYILANDLAVTVVQKNGLPLISLQLVIKAGESSAPPELPGLASFTANMIIKGTEELSSTDIDESIESIGGSFESAVYPESTIFTLSFLEENLDEAIDLFSKVIMNSTFPQREISSVKTSLYYSMVQKNTDTEFIARRLLFKNMFENHSYRQMTYTEDTFTKMDRSAAVAFYERFYRPNNARLIVIGNLNLQTATRKVSHYFNVWTKSNVPANLEDPPQPAQKIRIGFISQPNADEALILMGSILSPFTKQDYIPFSVFNHVFGETPTSRIFFTLRESKGYAYNAFSHLEMYNRFAVFTIQAWVRPEVTVESIKEIFSELDRAQKSSIPNTEIEQAKSYLIGNFPLKIEGFENFSVRIADIMNFNLGKEHWNGYYDAIMRINSDSVSEIIRNQELLSPVIVVVGNEETILEDLIRELDEVEIYDTKGNLIQTLKKEQRSTR